MKEEDLLQYEIESIPNQLFYKWKIYDVRFSKVQKVIPSKAGKRKALEKKYEGVFTTDTVILRRLKSEDRLYLTSVMNKYNGPKKKQVPSSWWLGYAKEDEVRGYFLFPCKEEDKEPKIVTYKGEKGFYWHEIRIWPKRLMLLEHQMGYSLRHRYFIRLPEPFLDFVEYESINEDSLTDRRIGFIVYCDELGNIILLRQRYGMGIYEPRPKSLT